MCADQPLSQGPYKIGLLLLEGFNAMAAQAFVDPFRSANYLRGEALYDWAYLSLEQPNVRASNRLSVSELTPIKRAGKYFDMIVVNASWTPEQFMQQELRAWLRHHRNRGAALCGLDTGAMVLAQAGLLQGRRAAIHYEHIAAFRERFPQTDIGEDLFVIDAGVLTCCGGLAASDLALEMIHQQHGLELANAAGRYIFHERLRSGDEAQIPELREPVGYATPKRLREAIMIMERNLETPLKIGDIAAMVSVSQRQLDRLFQRHTGGSPLRYYLDVRLDRARGLVTQTELSMLDVAVACGFTGNAQFARAYKRRFAIAPSNDRIEGRVPFQFRSYPSYAGV